MTIIPKHYSRKDLPFNKEMKLFWNQNGFIIIDNFYTENECNKLRQRAEDLIKDFNYTSNKTVINSKAKEHSSDSYFLESGDNHSIFLSNQR